MKILVCSVSRVVFVTCVTWHKLWEHTGRPGGGALLPGRTQQIWLEGGLYLLYLACSWRDLALLGLLLDRLGSTWPPPGETLASPGLCLGVWKRAQYTEPGRGWKWKIKMSPCLLGPLGPLKQIPKRIFVPSLCLLWAPAHGFCVWFFMCVCKICAKNPKLVTKTT